MISKSCKYAIRAVAYVASKAGEGVKMSVPEIAAGIDAPAAFTAKILGSLTRHRVITSLKGPYGGFFVEPHQLDMPVISIVNAIDGTAVFTECGMGLKQCSEKHPCPMHYEYKEVRDRMVKVFNETTIEQLAKSVKEGTAFLTR